MSFPDVIGLVGVIIITIVYFLLLAEKMSADHWPYSFVNALGALMILFSLMFKWNLASFAMEGTWFLISMYGVFKVVYRNYYGKKQ